MDSWRHRTVNYEAKVNDIINTNNTDDECRLHEFTTFIKSCYTLMEMCGLWVPVSCYHCSTNVHRRCKYYCFCVLLVLFPCNRCQGFYQNFLTQFFSLKKFFCTVLLSISLDKQVLVKWKHCSLWSVHVCVSFRQLYFIGLHINHS